MKIAILTTPNQWFVSYAKELQGKLIDSKLFFDHKDLEESYSTLRKLGVYVPGEEVRKVMSNIIMKKRS